MTPLKNTTTCPTCDGEGYLYHPRVRACETCGALGIVAKQGVRMTEKQKLLAKLQSLGYDGPAMDFFRNRTAQQLRVVLENNRTHAIIERVAKRAGEERQS